MSSVYCTLELRVSVCFIRYSGEKTRDNPEVPYVLRTGVKTTHHTPIAFSSVLCSFLLPHHVARRERPESLEGAYRKRRGVMSTPTPAAEQLKARLLRAFPTSVSPHTQPRMAMKRNAISSKKNKMTLSSRPSEQQAHKLSQHHVTSLSPHPYTARNRVAPITLRYDIQPTPTSTR